MSSTGFRRLGVQAGLVGLAGLVAGLLVMSPPATDPATASAVPASAKPFERYVVDQVIVGFQPGTRAEARASARAAAGAVGSSPLSPLAADTEVLRLGQGRTVDAAVAALRQNPNVRFAEPDYLVEKTATSNDPSYTGSQLWGMYGDATTPANQWGSQAGEAWSANHTGSDQVYVVVVDEGIDVSHPDLSANIWTNPFDPIDGVDNDQNGYIDDVNGWDFVYGDRSVYDAGQDSHGTHVAGTIGGVGGNGIGVAGVNWDVTMISAKFLGPNGGAISDAVRAVDYATDLKTRHGLQIVATSNSWGGGGFSQAMLDAINRGGNAGILFVAAAGNSSSNNDTTANYPSNYQCTNNGSRGWDCVVAVASITNTGAMSSFSSYGATTVDIGAPGSAITSTLPGNTYGSYSGTSMATPHVSGAVALCASISPSLSAVELRSAVVGSAAPTSSLSGRTVTGGRLDVGSMVDRCAPLTAPVTGTIGAIAATATSRSEVRVAWDPGTIANHLNWEIQRSPAGCSTWATVAAAPSASSSTTVGGHSAETSYCYRVRATSSYGGGSTSSWSATATATTLPAPAAYVCSATGYTWIDDSTATAHALGDDASVTVSLPFSFRHYDTTVTALSVSSNGYVRLGTGAATAYTNVAIPNIADPNGIVAAWWDDLNPATAGRVSSQTIGTAPNRRFVATWNGVPHFGATDTVTFQIVLEETTNAIVLQYLDATTSSSASNRGAGATIGTEYADGTLGTQISYNTAFISDASAYRCADQPVTAPVAVVTSTLPPATTGTAYSATVAATGGKSPYAWRTSSGSLPAGLTIAGSTGVISGTPTAAGAASFTVEVTDADARTSTASLSISVVDPPAVTTSSLPGGTVGSAYSATLAATGGSTPYTWSLISGALPAGMSLAASTGAISGTPSSATTASFTVLVSDSAGRTASRALTITVTAALPGAFAKSAPSNGATGRATSGLKLSWAASTSVTRYEVCWDTVNDGVCNATWVSAGTARSFTLPTLSARTVYYWQVRAVNGAGMTYANATGTPATGTWWQFTTK